MTSTPGAAENGERAATLRAAMTDRLIADGSITSRAVEAAFRKVARHGFVPVGTPVEAAYTAASSVVTRRDEHGADVASVSAPFIQARMIEG